MAFRVSRVSVDTTAIQLVDAAAGDVEAWIQVASQTGGDNVFLAGDSSVTTGNGFRLENTDNALNVRVRPGDELWAIAPGGGPFPVHILTRSA